MSATNFRKTLAKHKSEKAPIEKDSRGSVQGLAYRFQRAAFKTDHAQCKTELNVERDNEEFVHYKKTLRIVRMKTLKREMALGR